MANHCRSMLPRSLRRARGKRYLNPICRHPLRDRFGHVDLERRRDAVAGDVFELGSDRQPVRFQPPRSLGSKTPDRFGLGDRNSRPGTR